MYLLRFYLFLPVSKFHCWNKLFQLSLNFCKFSTYNLEFQKFFSIIRTIFLTVGQNNFGNKIPFNQTKTDFSIKLQLTSPILLQITVRSFLKPPHCTNYEKSIISFGYVYFQTKTLRFGIPPNPQPILPQTTPTLQIT